MDQRINQELPEGLTEQQGVLDASLEDPIPPGVTKISPDRLNKLREELTKVRELANTYTEVAQELNVLEAEQDAFAKLETKKPNLKPILEDISKISYGTSPDGRKQKQYIRDHDGLPTDASDGFLYFSSIWIQPFFMLGGEKRENSSYVSPYDIREKLQKMPEQLSELSKKYNAAVGSIDPDLLPWPIKAQQDALTQLQKNVSSYSTSDSTKIKDIYNTIQGWDYDKLRRTESTIDSYKLDLIQRGRNLRNNHPGYFADE